MTTTPILLCASSGVRFGVPFHKVTVAFGRAQKRAWPDFSVLRPDAALQYCMSDTSTDYAVTQLVPAGWRDTGNQDITRYKDVHARGGSAKG